MSVAEALCKSSESSLSQLDKAKTPAKNPRGFFAEIAQLVEHDLAKVGVAGSSPVFRSSFFKTQCRTAVLHLFSKQIEMLTR